MDEILPPKPLGELTGELKNLTSSLDLSYEDLLHIERLLQTQLGCAYSLSEYEKTHQPNRYKKTKRILEFIDKNFNYNRTDRGYTDIHNSLREYRAFLFQKKHEMDVREALHIQQEDFTIKLGRRKESLGGTIQNIQVYYKGQLIIDGDDPSQTLHIIINYENAPKRISTNDENDTRYIQKNQAYVWDIQIPIEYQGLWFAKHIYQQIANTLWIEVVRGDPISEQSISARKKREDKPFTPQPHS